MSSAASTTSDDGAPTEQTESVLALHEHTAAPEELPPAAPSKPAARVAPKSRNCAPSKPTAEIQSACLARVQAAERALQTDWLERLAAPLPPPRGRGSGSSGKGPALPLALEDDASEPEDEDVEEDLYAVSRSQQQQTTNHVLLLKARSVQTSDHDPPWLVGPNHPQLKMYAQLAQVLFRCCAVNCAITKREANQGATTQTTRICTTDIDHAACAQAVVCELAMALARAQIARAAADGGAPLTLASPLASNAVPAPGLWRRLRAAEAAGILDPSAPFAVVMTTRLVLNAAPTKLSAVALLKQARRLARAELERVAISETINDANGAVRELCEVIVYPAQHSEDPVWASWVLICFLGTHPRGRDLLRETGLTDVDLQIATAFEHYGRSEVVKRCRSDVKRKREGAGKPGEEGGRERVAAANTDGAAMLEHWRSLLESRHQSVLLNCVAHSRKASEAAATDQLIEQAGSSGAARLSNLRAISIENAAHSAEKVGSFIARRDTDVPALVCWEFAGERFAGYQRTPTEAHTSAVHACTPAPACLQPAHAMRIAWSNVSMALRPMGVEERHTLPAVLEGIGSAARQRATGRAHDANLAASTLSRALEHADNPYATNASGVARSTLSFECHLGAIHPSVRAAGAELAAALPGDAFGAAPRDTPLPLLRHTKRAPTVREPLCTAVPRLAAGLGLNEQLRNWMAGKNRKNEACKHTLGVMRKQDANLAEDAVLQAEPPPLLTIVDFQIDVDPATPDRCDLALHVGADGATRLPEALDALWRAHVREGDRAAFWRAARALLWAGASQASYVSNVGNVIASGQLNTAVASSKRHHNPEQALWTGLGPTDAYVVGLPGLAHSFRGTAYAGTYACRLDHGFAAPGIGGKNYSADKRQRSPFHLGQKMANLLATHFADAHWVSDKRQGVYAEAPPHARGIPHHLTAGVHACLDELLDALESVRLAGNREDVDAPPALQVLPFGPFTQKRPGWGEPTADLHSIRHAVRDPEQVRLGRAYLPDATREEDALLREPLFVPPSQTNRCDNAFRHSYEYMDSFFNNALHLAQWIRVSFPGYSPERALALAHDEIGAWVHGLEQAHPSIFAADALLLLNLMYPTTWAVAEPIVLPALACALPLLLGHWEVCRCEQLAALKLPAEDVAQLEAFWDNFDRVDAPGAPGTCAWRDGVAPLLELLIGNNGDHCDPRPDVHAHVRAALERAVRGAYLVHARDTPDGGRGVFLPCPAAGLAGPEDVRRPHLDPVFVGCEQRGVAQRGALVGVKPHQLRQVCALALGAHLPRVEVQVIRNEGNLSLRYSSAADIPRPDGSEPSGKECSAPQMEGDGHAYGSLHDKRVQCALQRAAWDKNAALLEPALTALRLPQPPERRVRGAEGHAAALQQAVVVAQCAQQKETDELAAARAYMARAACSAL